MQTLIYMQLMTMASRDQQLKPTTRNHLNIKYLHTQVIILTKKYEITQLGGVF